MGKIISEDATNIHFPQTCDVLVDDVEHRTVVKTERWKETIGGFVRIYKKVCHIDSYVKYIGGINGA